jgi:hypothetical protein
LSVGTGVPCEREFAVVVVLDDPRTRLLRGLQQREAPLEAHHHPERLLVRRRDERKPEARAATQAFVDPQALVVDGHGHERGTGRDEAVARTDRTRILEPHAIARIDERCGDHRERLLRAGDDEDLVRVARDPAICTQVRSDGLPQPRVTERLAVPHHLAAVAAPVLGRQAGPLRHRERIECRQGRGERAGDRGQAAALAEPLHRARHGARQARLHHARGCRDGLGRRRFQCFRDVRPRADARLDEPFGGQAVERFDHGRARDRKIACERARRGQPPAHRESAGKNEIAQADVQLRADRPVGSVIDSQREQERSAGPLDHRGRLP